MKYEVAEFYARLEGTTVKEKYCEKCPQFIRDCKGVIDKNQRQARWDELAREMVVMGRTSDGDLCPYAPKEGYIGWTGTASS